VPAKLIFEASINSVFSLLADLVQDTLCRFSPVFFFEMGFSPDTTMTKANSPTLIRVAPVATEEALDSFFGETIFTRPGKKAHKYKNRTFHFGS
jgi:hypothetical protein